MEHRVIALIDLDCFYAQVESVRHGYPEDQPLAVQQWQSLIAVNYAARKFGINRMDSVLVAKNKCPDLILVHTETLDDKKISLRPYREASQQILSIFQRFCKRIERASIDEAFFDLSDEARMRMKQNRTSDVSDCTTQCNDHSVGMELQSIDPDWRASEVIGLDQSAFQTESERLLFFGSQIVAEIRTLVKKELGYTCSAGISHSKMMAKLIAGRNKPNGQTVLLWSSTEKFMRSVMLRDLRYLGGKLGKELALDGIETGEDLQKRSELSLVNAFGEKTGKWLFLAGKGIDHSEVADRTVPMSIMAAKALPKPANSLPEMQDLLNLVVLDVTNRLKMDAAQFHRTPKTLTVHYGIQGDRKKSRTISCSLTASKFSQEAIIGQITELISRRDDVFPCWRLAVQLSNFNEITKNRLPQLITLISHHHKSLSTEEIEPIEVDEQTNPHEKEHGSPSIAKPAESPSSSSPPPSSLVARQDSSEPQQKKRKQAVSLYYADPPEEKKRKFQPTLQHFFGPSIIRSSITKKE